MRVAGFYAILAFLVLMALPARAITLIERGNGVAEMRGSFVAGDENVFRQFMAQPRARKIQLLWLHSHGGSLAAGVAIGRIVRSMGLATAVDANNAYCDSACTLVFVAGSRRHYVNGGSVMEGNSSLSGLGFHGAHIRPNSRAPAEKSESGTRILASYYRAMGVPGVADLIGRAAINTLFRPNGSTAMRLRIATTLGAP